MARIFRTKRRKVAVLAVIALLIAGVSVAAAAWLTGGTGPGRAKAGATLQALTVTAGPAASDVCYPGTTCSLSLHISNPNSALVITGIQPGTIGAQDSSDAAGCDASNLTVQAVSSLTIPLPAGESDIVIPNGVALASNAPTECAGATFTKTTRVNASTP